MKFQRRLLVPTKTISKADFMRLQAKVDAALRRSGFRDIEFGRDYNSFPSSTFRGKSSDTPYPTATGGGGGHGAEFVLVGLSDSSSLHVVGREVTRGQKGSAGLPDGSVSLFDTPRARAWAIFSQAAHDLPTDDKTRAVLVDVSDGGNQAAVGRCHGLSKQAVNDMVHRLCKAIGIDQAGLFSAVTDRGEPEEVVAPGPVRRLTKREIRRLKYEAPARRAS